MTSQRNRKRQPSCFLRGWKLKDNEAIEMERVDLCKSR